MQPSLESAGRVLVVDDEPSIRFVLDRALSRAGLAVELSDSLAAARGRLAEGDVDLVLLDVRLPDGSGLDLLQELQRDAAGPHVVVMTARESMDVAVEAMKNGARDFVVKPFDLERIAALALDLVGRPRGPALRPGPESGLERPGRLVGASPQMIEVFKAIGRIAPTDVTVLVVGESGTGKELVARAVHDNSSRAGGPFITVNSAAIPRDLIESELFGHEKGSFTGAAERRRGKFELADGGTLFLDEVGELPLPLQAKLLRVLQERVVERVGGHTPVEVDVRIVAATHRDLGRMVREGTFREDLYYRLAVVPLLLPPLRDREGDVRRLAESFVARWGPELTGHPMRLSEGAVRRLEAHAWPGNVRELENVVKRALLFSRGGDLTADDLAHAMAPPAPAPGLPPTAGPAPVPGSPVEPALASEAGTSVELARPTAREPGRDARPQPEPQEGHEGAWADQPLELLVEERLRAFLARTGSSTPEGLHDLVMKRVERSLLRLVLEHAGGNQLEAARLLGMNRNTLRKRIRELDVPMPERRRNRRRR